MKTAEAIQIALVAGGAGLAVGLVGLVVAWLTRRWSIRWQITLVAAVAVLTVFGGVLGIAWLMFLSGHDLQVLTVVTSIAVVVAILVAFVIGSAMVRWSGAVQLQARAMALGGHQLPSESGPRELRSLSAELAETQRRLEEASAREARLEDSRLRALPDPGRCAHPDPGARPARRSGQRGARRGGRRRPGAANPARWPGG